jgi:hypothetical protein
MSDLLPLLFNIVLYSTIIALYRKVVFADVFY